MKLDNMEKDTMIISIESYGKKYSVELSDCSTWKEVLNEFIPMLNGGVGYFISYDKLVEWAEETECIRD